MPSSTAAIIYLCWADEPEKYLSRALDSISKQTYPANKMMLVIVYNGPRSNEKSSLDYIKNELSNRVDLPAETQLLAPEMNLGYSGGNNLGLKFAVEHGADYVFLHNSDGYLADNAIQSLVEAMESDKTIGVCQPIVCLYPETNLINSFGNSLHYLAIGYCNKYRESVKNNYDQTYPVGYVSGAAAFLRKDFLEKFGYLNENFFLYHEDTEYSLRLRMLGYRLAVVTGGTFYHQYDFTNKPKKFFWIERNRHALKIIFYKWPTLILLLPIEIIFNIGLVLLSIFGGWFFELMRVYKYWLNPKNWSAWLALRREVQQTRKISDRKFMSFTTPMIGSGDMSVPNIVRICADFVFTIYGFLLKILIWW